MIIVGRNSTAAEEVINSLPKSDESQYEFVQADVSLMTNVEQASREIISKLEPDGKRLNFLVFTTGLLNNAGREETSDGIDKKMALAFYSRWKFVDCLLPLLREASDAGQDARVLSVFGASKGGPLNHNNLDRRRHYSLRKMFVACAAYNDVFVKLYAKKHPGIAFIHAYPGIVKTQSLKSLPGMGLRLIGFLTTPFGLEPRECAEYLGVGLFASEFNSGAYHIKPNGDAYDPAKIAYMTEYAQTDLYEHYLHTIGSISS